MATEDETSRLDGSFAALLDFLKSNRGFDFSGYKRTSLERRIRKRMSEVDIDSFADYQDHLEVTSDEFTELFNTILINVTGFFRDKPAWDYVTAELVPVLLDELPESAPIRVWSAACATGEEAYTIAMVLAERLGEDQFRERVKIYATDVDEDALTRARQAVYPRDALQAIPDGLAEKYFERGPIGHVFRTDLRRSVIFGRNDLVQDAPISRVDLLVSRNALMYFTPETQSRILSHFNFALKDSGYLFLGKSEMLITHTDLFTPYDLKWRIFKKVPRGGLRERLAFASDAAADPGGAQRQRELLSGALAVSPVASLIVDRTGRLSGVNDAARLLFGITSTELARPLQDLELSYRPADLRSGLERAYNECTTVSVGRVKWTPSDGILRKLEVTITPIPDEAGGALGAQINFADVTEVARLDDEHERAKRQLETAYEELQSTVEELETTNEELHSTNEELETTNEELQSSNEELETMNEELQSTNDELETMNDEQSSRSAELDRVNLFLEGILGSLGVGVVVLDSEGLVQVWNANSHDLWGLRADEVEGKHFLGLDVGFPIGTLQDPIRRVQSGDAGQLELQIDAVDRRGRAIDCQVQLLPLKGPDDTMHGTILLMSPSA